MSKGNDSIRVNVLAQQQGCGLGIVLIADVQRYLECTIHDDQLKSIHDRFPDYRKDKLNHMKNREDWIRGVAAGILLNQGIRMYWGASGAQIGKKINTNLQELPDIRSSSASLKCDLSVYHIDLMESAKQYDTAYHYETDFGADQKPYFKDYPDLFFNLSHSGRYVVCMISNHECGIDVDGDRKLNLSVAERFFSEEEYQWILDAKTKNECEWKRRFLRLWTIREAYAKAVGTGIFKEISKLKLCVSDQNDEQKISFMDQEQKCHYEIYECEPMFDERRGDSELSGSAGLNLGDYCISIVIRK